MTKNTCLGSTLFAACLVTGISAPPASAQDSFVDCPACPEMVAIPPGEFHMGATDEELRRAALPAHFDGREQPRHQVSISRGFAVSRFEISRKQFASFVDDSGYAPADGCWAFIGSEFIFDDDRNWRQAGLGQQDDHPVTCISWHDAVAYTAWLSGETGESYRLLSEAEWEYAARGGAAGSYWFGDSSDDFCQFINLGDISTRERFRWHEKEIKYAPLDNWRNEPCRDGFPTTAPVTWGPPNPFGLYNMLGNVTELVADCWHPDYLNGPSTQEPRRSSGDCNYRAMRGQGWTAISSSTRPAFRARMLATDRRFYLGIRVARDLRPERAQTD
jgi:formylglycine-generating enzyme required for sulfatase activity